MKKVFTIILFSLLTNFIFCQNNWVDQTTNGLNSALIDPYGLRAYDNMNAVVGGYYSQVFITTDGGNNWVPHDFSSVADSQDVIAVSMTDPNNIWVATEKGMILNTADGGSSWSIQFNDTNVTKNMNYIEMFDPLNGVAMADSKILEDPSVILKTTDGGQNWTPVSTQQMKGYSGDEWKRIDFVNMNTGYYYESGTNAQKLYKTTDGGVHWDTTNYSSVSNTAHIMKFYDENVGFAYNTGKICYTLDGGQSWNIFQIQDQGWGSDIKFIKNNNSFIVAFSTDYNIYFSADTGKSWTIDSSFSNNSTGIHSISFPDKDHGWVMSYNHIYYKNTNLLLTGLENNNQVPNSFKLYQNYPNPFNPSTKIKYSLPQKGFVTIKVFDMLGREVRTLINSEQNAGQHEINFNAGELPSGIYFYRIDTGNSSMIKKMVLLK